MENIQLQNTLPTATTSDDLLVSTILPMVLAIKQFSLQDNLISQTFAAILSSDSLFLGGVDISKAAMHPVVQGAIYTLITSDASNIIYMVSIITVFLVTAYIAWATWKITFYALIWLGF